MANQDPSFNSDQSRWQAVCSRQPAADGAFVYAVRTTGIYCRPTCSSRRPRRQNVTFFADWQAAEAAGFRPCKRCRPQQTGPDQTAALVQEACRFIEQAEKPPSLGELAAAFHLSPAHFHRLFKKVVGITPKQYAQEHRLNNLRRRLPQTETVTMAIYEAGYESGSRFYEQAPQHLGMTPTAYRAGGRGETIMYAISENYLGWVLVAATDRGLCRIDFGASPQQLLERLTAVFPQATRQAGDDQFAAMVTATLAFLEQPQAGLDLPLDIQGTAFQRRVWEALQTIPAGETASYRQIACHINRPTAARAVAGACAANRLAVAIPCHRVVRSDGAIGGYRWGNDRKAALLARESAAAPKSG